MFPFKLWGGILPVFLRLYLYSLVLTPFVSQLGEVMVSMASNLMLADERVLWIAQREAMACSRIIACLQKIAVYRLATAQAFSLVSPINNIMSRCTFFNLLIYCCKE